MMDATKLAHLDFPPSLRRGVSKLLVLVPMLTMKDARVFKNLLDQLDYPLDAEKYRRRDLTKSILAGDLIEAMCAGLADDPESDHLEKIARLTGTDQFAPRLVETVQSLAEEIDALKPRDLEAAQLAMQHLKEQAGEPTERHVYFAIEEAVATRRAQLRARPLSDAERPNHPLHMAALPTSETSAFSLS